MGDKVNDKAWDIGFHREMGDESNPTWAIVIGGTSNAIHFCDPLNAGTDWAQSASTVPSIYIHGSTAAPTQYMKVDTNGIYGTTMQINAAGTALQFSNAASWNANGTGTAAAIGPLFPGASATCKMWLKVLDNVGTAIYYIPAYSL